MALWRSSRGRGSDRLSPNPESIYTGNCAREWGCHLLLLALVSGRLRSFVGVTTSFKELHGSINVRRLSSDKEKEGHADISCADRFAISYYCRRCISEDCWTPKSAGCKGIPRADRKLYSHPSTSTQRACLLRDNIKIVAFAMAEQCLDGVLQAAGLAITYGTLPSLVLQTLLT